jgi:zinc transporter
MAVAGHAYGSDASGLVWGYLFDRAAGTAQPLEADSVPAWLAQGAATEGQFAWLHFNLSNAASEKWLKSHTVLADEFYESLHQGSRSTRIELADDTLIAVINDVLHDFSFDAGDISTLWLTITPQLVISTRRTPLKAIERVHQAVLQGEAIASPVDLLVHLLRDQADVLIKIVRDSVTEVDEIEDSLLAGRLRHKREDLGTMRRVLVRLQRLLAPEPAALFRLLQRPPGWIADKDIEELRQSTEEFAVVLNDMTDLQKRIELLQEEIAARVNEANGRSLFVLTIVTVLALPINMIAGLMGMNVGGLPLAEHPNGFWIVVGVVLAFTAVAGLVVARLQRD